MSDSDFPNFDPRAVAEAQSALDAVLARAPGNRRRQLEAAILAHPKIPSSAKVVAGVVCELFDRNGRESATATHAWIMRKTGFSISRQTIKRAIRAIEEAGYWHREVGAGPSGENILHPHWNALKGRTAPALLTTGEA